MSASTIKRKIDTILVQSGLNEDPGHEAIVPPLYLTSTHQVKNLKSQPEYQYSRVRNPTRDHLVRAVSELEGGANGCVTASGMAAIGLFLQLLKPDDLLLAPFDCYGRAYRLMCALSEKGHFKLKFINPYDLDEVRQACTQKPRMVFIETPSNPVMRVADIAAISETTKAQNPDCLIVCDNTFMSPVLQRPIEHGADLVNASSTKFLNGHSDVIGGYVVAKDQAIWEELDFWANSLGLIGSPFDAYMTLRGLRTLDVRVQRAQENAKVIAGFLLEQEQIEEVFYPGLPSHEHYETAQKQQDGPGAMLSFRIKGGYDEAATFTQNLQIFALAQSLGGTESLINHPATMTHVSMGEEARARAGVSDNLLRLSVGIENANDLCADLNTAIKALK